MGIVFGPVPSRRYGVSLGLDIVPLKTCTFSCVYCEVGRTTNMTIERHPFVLKEDLAGELKEVIQVKGVKPDYITFAGSGEPTLNSEIGRMIKHIKRNYPDYPVVVLTNGSLLWMKEVREELLDADIVEASLDTVVEEEYKKLNRPHRDILLSLYIAGLFEFRKVYKGRFIIEVLFAKGINDTEENISRLGDILKRLEPDSVHLNTVVRPPAEKGIEPVDEAFLGKVKERFGRNVEVSTVFHGTKTGFENIRDNILKALIIRPMSREDMQQGFNIGEEELDEYLKDLRKRGLIEEVEFGGKKYFQGIRYKGNIS